MSEERPIHETNQGARFERQDLNAGDVYSFLIGLALVCILVYFLLRGMYAYLDARARASQPPQNPLVAVTAPQGRNPPPDVERERINKTFPEPRLEDNERQEISQFRLQEEQTLNSYGWVDQPAGILHIPIERAMQLIAQRGLPTPPPAGTMASAPGKRKP